MKRDPDEPIIDEYLDCNGRKRRFQIQPISHGLFLEAHELRDDDVAGLRFCLPIRIEDPPPYGELRDHIRERLSQRDLVRHPRTGKLENLRRTIRAQVHDTADDGELLLTVDDMQITWRELGEVLAPYCGWGLRIQICEYGRE